MKLIYSIPLFLLLTISTLAHASDGISDQDIFQLNDSPMFLQNAILVAKNDRDHDGHDDDEDEFPDDPTEHSDRDKDHVGDNRDEFPDDAREHSDRDKDHVGDNQDEFPDDASEHSDHDKDRKGDNKDEDRDGDGYLNKHEKLAGSDPKDEDSIPADMDGDFLPDVIDPDIDGDGIANGQDLNPTNPVVTTDMVAPVIIAPIAVTAEATGLSTTVVTGIATATDNIDGIVGVISDAVGAYPVGTTTVTYTATDAAGNTSTVTQAVTVVDTTAPVITAPAAISLTSTDGNPVFGLIGQATATDAFAVNITNNATGTFPVGTSTVIWTATDASGNSATATQLVTVIANLGDITPPVISSPADITIEATGLATLVNLGVSSAIDLVDGAVAVTANAPGAFALGATIVTYSATDLAGNTATATQTVTVQDTVAPIITVPANVTGASGDNQPVSLAIGQAIGTDLFAVTLANNAPATFPVGTTTVTWSATDTSGNTSIASQLITVSLNDITPPSIIAPANISIEATGANTSVNIGTATANDNVNGVVAVTNDAPATFSMGTTTVTYSVTDAAGNSSTASQVVTVVDTTVPVITAPAAVSGSSLDNQAVNLAIGNATASDAFAVNITNDAPAAYPVGSTTVTWTATDANGNSATALQLVTISLQDTTPPSINAPADVTMEATAINSSVSIASVTATDNVDGTVNVNSNAPALFPLGTTTITYSAIDAAGNSSTATQLVTIVDTTAPILTAPVNASGTSSNNQPVSVAIAQPTATDAFAVTVTSDAPALFPVGTTTVIWTATDSNGNTSTTTQQVSVSLNDVTAPSMTVPADITAEATGVNTAIAIGAATAIDDLDGAVNVSSNAPASFPLGTTTVTYSARDAAGNRATANQQITIVDSTPPLLTTPANASGSSADNQPVAVAIGQATASDVFAVTITSDAPATYPVGATTITWTARDSNGNNVTATQLVTVSLNDVTPPSIAAPANVTVEATGVNSSVNLGSASATDVVDGPVAVSNNAPATFPLGNTTVTYSATDAAGNAATATQVITVVDNTAPLLSAPANITSSSGNGQPISLAIGQATATDAFAVTITNDAPVTFPVGTTTVTWTATDANGNSATVTQLVTVSLNDVTPPTITAPANVTAEATATNSIIAIGSATAIDDVDGLVNVTSNAPTSFPLGVTTITYSASDAAGNNTTATQTVTVVDTTAPVLTAPANASGSSSDNQPVSVAIGLATANDIFAVTISNDAPATYPVGTTTVTWTATDASGNASVVATQLVTVSLNDVTPPSIAVPAAVTAEATATNTTVNLAVATATDAVDGIVNVTSDAPAFFPLGTTTVTYSASDAAGNTTTATQLVSVVDTTSPVITAPADVSGVSADNQPVLMTISQATAIDVFAVTITNNAPASFPVGQTSVVWTASDINGNSATATQLVTITLNDVTPPVVSAPSTVTIEASSALMFILDIGWATAIDAVDANVSITNDAPVSYPLGTTSIIWTATDAAGNSSTAVQNVIIQDTIVPVITAPTAVVLTSSDGNPVAGAIGQANATDAFAVTVSNNAPASFPVGNTTVTWMVTDANGNSATATQLVTVSYTAAAFTFNSPPDLVLETTSASGIPASQISFANPTYQSTVSLSWRWSYPTIFRVGVSQVNWVATDANGNVINAVQTVTVNLIQDITPPVITAPADVQVTSFDGNPVTASIGQATAIDNVMGQINIINDAPLLFPIGITTVTWTATDASANSSFALQRVVVAGPDLPPDPGPNGQITLEGIDSDNDGVRDDVQRWIVLTYPTSEKTRAALLQGTKTMQGYLLNAADPIASYNSALQMDKDENCLAYILSSGFSEVSSEHQAVFLNTYQRSKAWLKADLHLSGKMFKGLSYANWKSGCNFNPDAMLN